MSLITRTQPVPAFEETLEEIEPELAKKSIEELTLSTKAKNALRDQNIGTIGRLMGKYTERSLLKVKNFGRKSLQELKEELGKLGLSLRKE